VKAYNTTQRVMATGIQWHGDWPFYNALRRNNPWCGKHWQACIENNPGAYIPNHNPTELEDMIARIGKPEPVAA
jgi:hypothetical protein